MVTLLPVGDVPARRLLVPTTDFHGPIRRCSGCSCRWRVAAEAADRVEHAARLDPGRVEVLAGPMALVWVPTDLPLVSSVCIVLEPHRLMDDVSSILCSSEMSGARVQRDLRVSDAERQAVVRRLELALHDGRLTIAEFDERSKAAYAARTRGELDDLTDDLPRNLW